MKVIVCGGRHFGVFVPDVERSREGDCVARVTARREQSLLFSTLDRLNREHGFTMLAHGGASGADRLAAKWAMLSGVPQKSYVADWKRYGRSAGPRRNAGMLDAVKPGLVIAFPGGAGTKNCVELALTRDVRVVECALPHL